MQRSGILTLNLPIGETLTHHLAFMEFKIDTKPTYCVVTPVTNLIDANLTAALRQKWKELAETGSRNLIVDLHNCMDAGTEGPDALIALHDEVYAANESLVFTQLQNRVLEALKLQEADLNLNLAPTLNEAIDIVSMEILERDLFSEES